MVVDHSILKKVFKDRYPWAHKGDYGKLLVVGGSNEYSGSPALNALAAIRSGVDLVRIAAPESVAHTIRTYSPELIVHPLPGEYLSGWHDKRVIELQQDCDAMVIGGGLTKNLEVMRAIRKILKETKIPTVIDADALAERGLMFNKKVILTPHAYEFYQLTGIQVSENIEERILAAKQLANEKNCIVLLKGHIDVITDGEKVELNKTGTPYMTKGGSGDCLAGIIGALLARGIDPFTAACCGAYINGKAGRHATHLKGEGLMVVDIINAIPEIIKSKSMF